MEQEQRATAMLVPASACTFEPGKEASIHDILGRLPPDDAFLHLPIESLTLGVRTRNVCRSAGLALVGDLLKHDDSGLLRHPAFGRRTILELKRALMHRIGPPAGPSDSSVDLNLPQAGLDAREERATAGSGHPRRLPHATPHLRPHVPVLIDRRAAERAPDIAEILRRLDAADPLLEHSFKTFRLSVRTSNIFRRVGIERVRDLIGYTDAKLLELPALGLKCLTEVKVAVLSRMVWAKDGAGEAPGEQLQAAVHPSVAKVRRHVLADDEIDFESAVAAAPVTMVDPGDNVLEEIRNIVCAVLPLGRSSAANEQALRNRRLVLDRYGVDGPAKTLEELGQQLSLTRERARQIVEKAAGFGARLLYPLDRPSHFGEVLRALRPGSTPRARRPDDGLDDLLGPTMTLFDAARFFEDFFGLDFLRDVTESFSRSRYGLEDQEESELRRDLRAMAVDIIDAVGAVHVNTVIGSLYERISGKLSRGQVFEMLCSDRRLAALPGPDGWIWFAPPRPSRFQVEVEKMLIVAGGRVDLYDLQSKYREARSRRDAHRLSDVQLALLPLEVAKAVMQQMDWARQVQSNDYVYTGSRTMDEVLTPVELALIKTIEELGGAGGSFEVARGAHDRYGLLMGTAIMGLHSGTVTHRADYGARVVFGRPLAPVMERLREVVRTSRYTRQSSGPFEIRTTVTTNYLQRNCNIGIHAALWTELNERGVSSIHEESTGLPLHPRRSGDFHYLLGGTGLMRALGAREGQTLVLVIDATNDPVRAFASLESPPDEET